MRFRVLRGRWELDRLALQPRLPLLLPRVGRPHERPRPQVDHVLTGLLCVHVAQIPEVEVLKSFIILQGVHLLLGHGWFYIDVGCSFQHQVRAVGSFSSSPPAGETSQLLVNEQMRHPVVLSNLLISCNQDRLFPSSLVGSS